MRSMRCRWLGLPAQSWRWAGMRHAHAAIEQGGRALWALLALSRAQRVLQHLRDKLAVSFEGRGYKRLDQLLLLLLRSRAVDTSKARAQLGLMAEDEGSTSFRKAMSSLCSSWSSSTPSSCPLHCSHPSAKYSSDPPEATCPHAKARSFCKRVVRAALARAPWPQRTCPAHAAWRPPPWTRKPSERRKSDHPSDGRAADWLTGELTNGLWMPPMPLGFVSVVFLLRSK